MKNAFCLGWRSKVYATFFDVIHQWQRLFVFSRNEVKIPDSLERVLLCNWANLGDLLLATSVVSAIKERFPHCKIGILVSKRSRVVLETCWGIDWIHETENVGLGETKGFQKLIKLIWFSATDQKKLVGEIKSKKYECALELFPFFPNTIPILWKAKIPVRIGFDTGGNSSLLNIPVSWKGDRYVPFHYADLLEKLGVQASVKIPIKVPEEIALHRIKTPYFVFHPCASRPSKEFPIDFWKSLYSLCKKSKISVYFSGRGEREKKIIQAIGVEEKEDLSDRLSWSEFVKVIHSSQGVVSVDSVPVHLAAALKIPFAVLYKQESKIWFPESNQGFAFGVNKPACVEEIFSLIRDWIQ